MIRGEREKAKTPDTVLREAGFSVSEKCYSRPCCFDYVSRKGENLVLINIKSDIDCFSSQDSEELKMISECMSAASLLIGEKTREKPLEDDTVYSRYDVLAVTPKTFENFALRKTQPLIQAGPGGYYVEVEGMVVKRKRQELGLSAGEMAKIMGVSRRTLYGYEQGMAKASVTAAYKLIYTLGLPIAKPVNLLEKSKKKRKCFLSKAGSMLSKNKLLKRILRKLDRYRITTVKKAPFDFVMNLPDDKTKIIGGVTHGKEAGLNRRVDEILSFSRVCKARPILITEGEEPQNKKILCIRNEELSKTRNPEELILSA